MKIDILSLFPKMFKGPFEESIIKRAKEKKLVEINIHNLRDWAFDKHKIVDDRPFGGGVGMIMKVDVIDKAVQDLKRKGLKDNKITTKVILLDAGGKKFTQEYANKLSKYKHLIIISGHYEGVDYRVHKHVADEIISIGDYILTGGEIPTMIVVDSIVRLIPNVITKQIATESESFSVTLAKKLKLKNLLEYPQYTRPVNYKGWRVPSVLLSGNHKEIEKWRLNQALKRTLKFRPDLLKKNSKL